MVEAVIYDLDDLLVNSMPLHSKAWDELLEDYDKEYDDIPPDVSSGFVGMRIEDILKEIIDYFDLDANAEELYEKREKIFLELVEQELELMPGAQKALELLQGNYHLALASSGTKKYINQVLKKFDFKDYFEIIVSGDDVSKGKPDPEPYEKAAEKLELHPSQCLVLEDATKGVESAKEAGCKCIAVENENTPPQDLSKADFVLTSLEELTKGLVEAIGTS